MRVLSDTKPKGLHRSFLDTVKKAQHTGKALEDWLSLLKVVGNTNSRLTCDHFEWVQLVVILHRLKEELREDRLILELLDES